MQLSKSSLKLLKEKAIPLEICPTSNIRAGVIKDLAQHPIRELYDSGVIVTVNTDNPQYLKIKEASTGTLRSLTLADEYYYLITKLSFSIENIKKMILNGVDAAFIPVSVKEKLRSKWFSFDF